MDGDSTVSQKFAVSLKSKDDDQNQGKLPDPYSNSKSSIWSKIILNYTDETFLIFVSNQSREAYESIYRLIGIVSKYIHKRPGNLIHSIASPLHVFSNYTKPASEFLKIT